MQTIIYDDKRRSPRYVIIIGYECFAMSNNPQHVCGANWYIGDIKTINTKRLGKQVLFDSLPFQVQEAILMRKHS